MADFDAQQPVRAIATQFTTEVANATGTTINPAEDFAQGSTTSGQNGVLIQAAVTTAVPTYTTGTTNPLSMDLNGNLRVAIDASSSEQNVNLNQVGGSAIALGQTTMANSLPVVLASNQSAIPVTLTSTTITGTVAVTQSTSPWVVSGTVTSNIGTTGGLALDATLAKLTLAQSSTTSGQTGSLILGATTTAAPTYTTATSNPLSLTTSGALRTDSSATTQPVSGTVTANAGTGTFAENLTQVGGSAISLGQKTMANSIPVVIASDQSGIPITVVDSDAYAQGSTTSGQLGGLTLGAVTTAAPSYTTATSNVLSLTTAGALRVDGSGVTQPVSGTVTANAGTGNFTVTQATGTNLHTVVDSGTVTANAGTGTFNIQSNASVNITQVNGSALSLGQTTMASSIPVVLASNQTPINVQIGGVTPVVTYATTASVASNATATQSVAGPINLDAIHCTASGEIKVVIAIGTTGSEVTKYVGFTSASNKNFDWVLPDTYVIPTGSSVKITITNFDKSAMDVYSSITNH